jgi:hypothetical protein
MTALSNSALTNNTPHPERLMPTPQEVYKIRCLLDSDEETNIRMALQIVKGMGVPKELHQDFNNTFLKVYLCLEEGILAPLQSLPKLELFALEQLTHLPEAIGSLHKLKMLNLCANALQTIPESIGKLQKLQYLNLDSNHLQALPDSLGQLKQLEWLQLGQNKLETLPESIGQLKNLRYLNLNRNHLTNLPSSFLELRQLTELYLEGNQLTKGFVQHLQSRMPNTRIIY